MRSQVPTLSSDGFNVTWYLAVPTAFVVYRLKVQPPDQPPDWILFTGRDVRLELILNTATAVFYPHRGIPTEEVPDQHGILLSISSSGRCSGERVSSRALLCEGVQSLSVLRWEGKQRGGPAGPWRRREAEGRPCTSLEKKGAEGRPCTSLEKKGTEPVAGRLPVG
ncbi:hypothetical protein KUCAC02_015404 [Chaenocephalus aceratus]|uniref:Uncharacterized protein n=1 Tax=Chaenocephalus aceratus TaxID=36190 RepID=A0ACB9XZN6_CHAAC|nr:hypothetical protein KUCAC02_015404 [Chaenocephalus aceratus]